MENRLPDSGGDDDPCSECRWFGGESRCTLLAQTSYNDQLWLAMMARGKHDNYTLAAHKGRKEGGKKGKKGMKSEGVPKINSVPTPMPANKVKPDWQGETRETLLSKGDMLPLLVRLHGVYQIFLPNNKIVLEYVLLDCLYVLE